MPAFAIIAIIYNTPAGGLACLIFASIFGEL